MKNSLKQFSKDEVLAAIQVSRTDLIDFSILTLNGYQPNWHHEVIADALMRVERGEIDRLIISVPPRHGKSELASIRFPAWYLGRHPDKEVITASYSADLAVDFGSKTRALIEGEQYRAIFKTRLRADERAKGKWLTEEGGGYTSVGVGGPITGRGADCFVAGTMVHIEGGTQVTIESLHVGDRVLSYSHDRKTVEYNPVVAVRRVKKNNFATITTSGGRTFTATLEHPVFVVGKGYIKVQDLKEGDSIHIHKGGETRCTEVCALWNSVREGVVRVPQKHEEGAHRRILFSEVFRSAPRCKKQERMRDMWEPCYKKDGREVLFEDMQTESTKTTRHFVWLVRCFISPVNKIHNFLLNGVQKLLSRSRNGRKGKPKLQARERTQQIPKRVLQDSSACCGEGQDVSSVWEDHSSLCSSQGLRPNEQHYGKPDNCVYGVSHGTPQLDEDTVSTITPVNTRMDAYDIQVGRNENFFAEGVLVHNCLIIDDPLKNREEADSAVIRDKVWNWYTSTAYTRLEKGGAVILILTRWHLDDIAGRIASSEDAPRWTVIRLPAIAEHDEEHRKEGEALWPSKYSVDELMRTKSVIGTYDWSSLYQQTPILTENQEFKPHYFKTRSQAEIDRLNVRKFLTIDTAISKSASADYTGICDNTVDSENKWNLDAWRVKIGPKELIDMLFTLYARRNYEKIGIEKTIYLSAIKPFLDDEMRKRNTFLPVVELQHNQIAKEIRIRGLLPRYQAGAVYHIEGKCKDLEEEMLSFPLGIHDDTIDAVAYQLQIALAPYRKPPQLRSEEQEVNIAI